MAISLLHAFVSPVADAGVVGDVSPDDWNDEHVLVLDGERLVGKPDAGSGNAIEIPIGGGLSFVGGALVSETSTLDESGVAIVFRATTPPTGWTKDTTAALNNTCPRIITGSIVDGGATAFTSVFGSGKTTGNASPGTNSVVVNVDTTGISAAQTGVHDHDPDVRDTFVTADNDNNIRFSSTTLSPNVNGPFFEANTANAGSGSAHDHGTVAHSHTVDSHAHTLSLDLAFTDLTIGIKD